MTKPREHGSRFEALHQDTARLGFDHACELTGRTEGHLRHCSDPDEGRELSLPDALALIRGCAQVGAPSALLRHATQVYEQAAPEGMAPAAQDPHRALLGCVATVGALSGTMSTAMHDGKLSLAERRLLLGDIATLETRLAELSLALKSDPQDRRLAELEHVARSAAGEIEATRQKLRREENLRRRLQNRQAAKGLRR